MFELQLSMIYSFNFIFNLDFIDKSSNTLDLIQIKYKYQVIQTDQFAL